MTDILRLRSLEHTLDAATERRKVQPVKMTVGINKHGITPKITGVQ